MNKERRLTLRRCTIAGALIVSAALGTLEAAAQMAVRVAGPDVAVSFDLHSRQTDDLVRRFATDVPVSVAWVVNVRQRLRLWRDPAVQRAIVRVTGRRAGVPPLFAITRTVNGRHDLAVQAPLADSLHYFTAFEALPLFDAAELSARGGYRLEISAIVAGGGQPTIETPVLAEVAFVR